MTVQQSFHGNCILLKMAYFMEFKLHILKSVMHRVASSGTQNSVPHQSFLKGRRKGDRHFHTSHLPVLSSTNDKRLFGEVSRSRQTCYCSRVTEKKFFGRNLKMMRKTLLVCFNIEGTKGGLRSKRHVTKLTASTCRTKEVAFFFPVL